MAAFPLWFAVVLLALATADYENKYKPAYNTVLQKKCELLKMRYSAAYVGDRCFAATTEKYRVNLTTWDSLHSKCNHVNGYKSHMAHIWTEKQLNVLLEEDVLKMNERYLIGARQTPTDKELDIECCNGPLHSERWKYLNVDGQELGELNSKLWLKDQPDDAGDNPPEVVVVVEKLNTSHKLGFNDVNPETQDNAVLCEYVDFLVCPDEWTLIGNDCYKVFTNELTYDEATSECQSAEVNEPKLAAIHEDSVNQHLAILAREALNDERQVVSGDFSHNPVMFGLVFRQERWEYASGDDHVDFFRWYHKAGLGEPVSFAGKNDMVALLNTYPTGASGEPRYTYWTVGDGRKNRYPFICQGGPLFDTSIVV